jgi:hypothetical protein
MASRDAALTRVRKLCLSLPDATERISHGTPTFFIGDKRSFLTFLDNHHGDGRLAVWCAAPPDAQAMLVDSDPEVFFVPAYVGHLGWVGVRLDRDAPWPMIARVIEDAYHCRAPAPRKARAASKPAAQARAAATAPSREPTARSASKCATTSAAAKVSAPKPTARTATKAALKRAAAKRAR